MNSFKVTRNKLKHNSWVIRPFLSSYLITEGVSVLKMIVKSYYLNQGISSPKKQIPKLLIYIFLSFIFFFGFDFGFTELIHNRKLRFLVKLVNKLSAFVCASILLSCVLYMETDYSFWHCLNVLQYLLCFFVLSTAKYNLFSFTKDLYSSCTVTRKDRAVTVVVICLFLTSSIKISVLVSECLIYESYFTECKMGVVPLYLYLLPCISMDVAPLVLITSSYYMNNFMTCLKESYFKSEICLDNLEKNYIIIMDCFDKIKPLYGNLVSIYDTCL